MGYFKKVKFVFLIVGHTKNAADQLFNSLKHEYRKQNIFTMQALFDCLNVVSDSVTVVPLVAEDFLDYDVLFDDVYHSLSGMVKKVTYSLAEQTIYYQLLNCMQETLMSIRQRLLRRQRNLKNLTVLWS